MSIYWRWCGTLQVVMLYEPDINPTYLELATYYQTAVIPTRVIID